MSSQDSERPKRKYERRGETPPGRPPGRRFPAVVSIRCEAWQRDALEAWAREAGLKTARGDPDVSEIVRGLIREAAVRRGVSVPAELPVELPEPAEGES